MSDISNFNPKTIEDFKKYMMAQPIKKISIYILQNGDIIDCRSMGMDHIEFATRVYRNISEYKEYVYEDKHIFDSCVKDISFAGVDDDDMFHIVKNKLFECAGLSDDFKSHRMLIGTLSNKLGVDDYLVHDVGFIKFGIVDKSLPIAMCAPSTAYRGHRVTSSQRRALLELADFFYYDYDESSREFRNSCIDSEHMSQEILDTIDG